MTGTLHKGCKEEYREDGDVRTTRGPLPLQRLPGYRRGRVLMAHLQKNAVVTLLGADRMALIGLLRDLELGRYDLR